VAAEGISAEINPQRADKEHLVTTVTSRDGTEIAFDRIGSGGSIVLVDGALSHRAAGPNGPLAKLLAERFAVYTYDRRGRGDSGDTHPYEVVREIEDLEAVITEAGGSAYVYGISSGGVLALEAATRLDCIDALALYELPFVVDDTRAPIPPDFGAHLTALIASDRRGEAVKYFMTVGVGLRPILVAMMRLMPMWSKLKALAHTLPYDATILGPDTGAGQPLPTRRWASLTAPTLVIGGGKSPGWVRNSVQALAELLGAEQRTLERQTHMVKPRALAPVLMSYFDEQGGSHRVERTIHGPRGESAA
jgi:pimeloyl-ACP methyl ester carboxylesterase